MRPMISVVLLFAIGSAAADDKPLPYEEAVKPIEQEIERAEAIDKKLPAALQAHLDYAQLLARYADGDCADRLMRADANLRLVRDSPVASLELSTGPGRIPYVGYTIELARARCAPDKDAKLAAIQEALRLARESVEGFRSAYLYESMAFAQYNVAQTAHDLGDTATAIKEIEAAIDMDRTYNMKDDAADNFRTLRKWQGKEATDAEVEEFLKGFTTRSATFKFGWKPFRVDITASYDTASYDGTGAKHTRFVVPASGQLKADKEGFVYEIKPGEPKLDASSMGDAADAKIVGMMARILSRLPAAVISDTGEFKGVRGADEMSKAMGKEIDSAIASTFKKDDPRMAQVKSVIDQTLRPGTTPEMLQAKFQEGYALETGIWINATLEQGVLMQIPLTMSMNGTPQGFVEQQAQFVLSRWLPCASGMPADGCVELLLDARPTQKALDEIAKNLASSGKGKLDYEGETRVRLVVDPATLTVYENDTRKYSYLALTNEGRRALKIDADTASVTYRYRK